MASFPTSPAPAAGRPSITPSRRWAPSRCWASIGSFTTAGFFEDTFAPLLSWNRWWDQHRQTQGYLAWGNDGPTDPTNLDDRFRETGPGTIYESGLDNSPMYDGAAYDQKLHLMEIADVGLMSMYIADCDALAQIADELGRSAEAKELRARSDRYRASLATLWSEPDGIFLNKDLHTGQLSHRLSPTNFYPLLARAATPAQAQTMIQKHLLNTDEFWGQWVIPSIARNDPAFSDQDYWRGRIWGPMNYLVYLGLRNYDDPEVRRDFAQKSYELFLKEWKENGHVHENYNAITGSGDDVKSSDRFYHWGALLGYVEYMEQTHEVRRIAADGGDQCWKSLESCPGDCAAASRDRVGLSIGGHAEAACGLLHLPTGRNEIGFASGECSGAGTVLCGRSDRAGGDQHGEAALAG
jgi:hypothetical protein